jgi:MoxR-like ATPase
MLEAMQERQVSFDGVTYPLPSPFLTIATQNPIEQAGTYTLPEAQLDRFLIRQFITYPRVESEYLMLQSKRDQGELPSVDVVGNAKMILEAQNCVSQKIIVSDKIIEYIVNLVRKSREVYGVNFGASPRASIALLNLCRARAAIEGRDFVQPDDVKRMVFQVLNHRLILTAEAELESLTITQVVNEIIENIQVVI